MNTQSTLSINLKHARQSRGLSCIALAKLAGLPQSAVGKISRGEVPNPGVHSVGALAIALKVPLDWLVNGRGPSNLPRGRRTKS